MKLAQTFRKPSEFASMDAKVSSRCSKSASSVTIYCDPPRLDFFGFIKTDRRPGEITFLGRKIASERREIVMNLFNPSTIT